MQTPKFMMGGIRLSQNFVGTSTMKAGAFTFGETVIKNAPLVMIFYALAQTGNTSGPEAQPTILVEGNLDAAAPVTRSRLMQ